MPLESNISSLYWIILEQVEHQRKAVEQYLVSQLGVGSGDLVHVEMIQTHWIGPERYEVWDCHTKNDGRWWVINPMTNLYDQAEFRSADYTLTFHIGITHRISWKGDREPEPRPGFEGIDSVFREVEKATEMAYQVVDVQEAQSAGVALREALISLSTALMQSVPAIAQDGENLKTGDFAGWTAASAGYLAGGHRKRKLRRYLTTSAKGAWEYVNWLTHDRQGTQAEAIVGATMVQRVVVDFVDAVLAYKQGKTHPICPRCKSRRIGSDTDYFEDGYQVAQVCEVCEWRSEDEHFNYACTPGNDGPGLLRH